MIKIENLVKRYGDKVAVDNISFDVAEGEIVGFLGPNGAGKTTTMNILTGYLSSTSGRASINGLDILEYPLEAKRCIGFLPEQPPLYLEMTVREYLNFIYDLKKCTFNRRAHIGEICDVIGIGDVSNRIIRNLSKGYRQRVGIAQAIIGNPKVIVFDEPTNGLDPKQIIEIRNLIRALGHDHTVILSTHILPEVQAVCDRIIIINKGRLVANEKAESLAASINTNRRFHVKICGPKESVVAMLKGILGMTCVEVLAQHEADSFTYLIESEPGTDIRKQLFHELAEHDWPLISLEPQGASLEDVFISLVGGDKNNKTKEDK